MNKQIVKTVLAFVFIFNFATNSFAQPFLKEVNYFKKLDSITPPPTNPILFIGSSSFTKWVDVKNYFPGYTILNRAFGGSSLPDVIHFAEEVIFKYNPKQIVIYCGENDVAANASAETVLERFKTLHTLIRTKLPKVSIVFVSLKPSPSREKFWPVMIEANGMIKQFAKKTSSFRSKTKIINCHSKKEEEMSKSPFSPGPITLDVLGLELNEQIPQTVVRRV